MPDERVTYRDLGIVEYVACWKMQQQLFDALLAAKSDKNTGCAEQYLLMCEHPPVYTLGKSGHANNMLAGEGFLISKGASLFHIDRGGDITFHGPGQLVGYPILDLEREGIGLKDYIRSLEEAIIRTVSDYGIKAERVERAAGVWITSSGPLRKIAAIGVRSSRYVTMHGFALNVNTDLGWFEYINPCGFSDRGVTSMERESGGKVDMQAVKRSFAAHFEKIMNIKINTEDYAYRKTLGDQASGRPGEGG